MFGEKVHDVISYKQKPWLKPYIDFNTNKRASAKNDFDKDLPKSMNCSFYGKTMGNIRNRLELKFIKKDDDDKMVKMQSKFDSIHQSYHDYDSCTF